MKIHTVCVRLKVMVSAGGVKISTGTAYCTPIGGMLMVNNMMSVVTYIDLWDG